MSSGPSPLLVLPVAVVVAVIVVARFREPIDLSGAPRQPPPASAAPAARPPAAPAGLPPSYTVELDGAAEAPPSRRRVAPVALAPVNGRAQRVDVVYDREAVAGPTTVEALRDEPDWVPGVRLLLGEMGAWRLATNRWSLLEGVGILETVANRFEPDLANPLRKRGVKAWPGCGQGASFATCIDPAQYLGIASDRALRPREACPDAALLAAAIDRAVAAWFVYEEALLGEITSGATSFVHLCGGGAYGAPAAGCAEAGGEPNRGPIVFRGPAAWLPGEGRYALEALGVVDFEDADAPTATRAYVDYLLSADASRYAGAATRP
jgi:hypothetical protein